MTDILRKPRLTRRHFLLGTGGFTLAVPFLSSVLPRGTRADASVQKRFVALATDHGGVFPTNLYPVRPMEWETRQAHPAAGDRPAHEIGAGPLVVDRSGGEAYISRCLRAPETLLTPALAGKLSFLAGLSLTTYVGHNRGVALGNYGANDQGKSLHHRNIATIDQLIAKSPGFALSPTSVRSVNFSLGHGGGSGVRHAASADTVGGVTSAVQADRDPRDTWQRLFGGQTGGEGGERPQLVVDRVYEHYRGLTTGAFGDASRLSRQDRQRLEAHMERLLDLERRLYVPVDCGAVPQPGRVDGRDRMRDAVDLAVTALSCGATHVAVLTADARHWSDDPGWTNWHEQVAHNGGGARDDEHDPEFQRINYEAQGAFFRDVFLRLAAGLDAVEEDAGDTLLDRSLVMWGMESGDVTHSNVCMPVVTAGGAAGTFATGRFIDFRNLDNLFFVEDRAPETFPGLLYNRYLATVLRGFGVQPGEWGAELARVFGEEVAEGARGYGAIQYHPHNFYDSRPIQDAVWPWSYYEEGDEPLPFFAV